MHTVLCVYRYDIMQLCWKPAEERPTMADILSQLESLRDEFARNTPFTASGRKKRMSFQSPKTTPTAPPTKQVPVARNPASDAVPARKFTGAHKPRRPAPKVPEEGSMKRRSTMQAEPVLNGAHHTLEKSDRAQPSEPSHEEPHGTEHEIEGMLKWNPLFEEMERKQREKENKAGLTGERERASQDQGGGLQEEGDPREGVLFVNRSAKEKEEEEEEEEEEERGEEGEGGEEEGEVQVMEAEEEGEWEEEDEEDDNFILEPPEDFSQSSMEREDETGLISPTNQAPSHTPYDPTESHYTSIDDFDPSTEESSREPSPEEQRRTNSVSLPAPQKPPGHTAHNNMDTRESKTSEAKGKVSADMSGSGKPGDRGRLSPQSHHRREEPPPAVKSKEHGKHSLHSKKGKPNSTDEPDSQYRQPTGSPPAVKSKEHGKHSLHGRKIKPNSMGDPDSRYHQLTPTESPPAVKSKEHGKRSLHGRKGKSNFADDQDSRYRRPTGRIPGLVKRAPSWGKGGALEEDDLPNVVYDDEVAELLW